MLTTNKKLHSKRAAQIIVCGGDAGQEEPLMLNAASERMRAVKHMRDQFDFDSQKVGLRDSTWLITGIGVLLAIATTWGQPRGLDLFARMLVIGGGVTIVAAVLARKKLE